MKPLSAYHQRSIQPVSLFNCGEWSIKFYQITKQKGASIPDDLLTRSREVVSAFLAKPRPPKWVYGEDWANLSNYGLGFAMIHVGSEAVFLLLDLWVGENMLLHEVWVCPLDGSGGFEPITGSGVSVCVWELAVQHYEREAWLRHIYRVDQKPDVESYLADQMSAEI